MYHFLNGNKNANKTIYKAMSKKTLDMICINQ